jgi:hypothetical protein
MVSLAVLLVLAILQLVLPPIATRIMRGRLGEARIDQASLSAFPAIKLLWGDADRVTLRLSTDNVQTGRLDRTLGEMEGVTTVDARVGRMTVGPLILHDVSFQKHGPRVNVTLRIDQRDLRAALPIIKSVMPVSSGGGQLTLRGRADILGLEPSVEVVVAANDGRVVVAPTGLIGAIATITVFSDPRFHVDTVGGHAVPGGLDVTVRARMN